MSTPALKQIGALVVFALVGAVVALTPSSLFAQQTEEPSATVVDGSSVITNPYKTEQLLGDEVYGDFVLGPGKLELSINPGETKVVEITVSNRTGVERIFEVTAEDAKGSSDPTQTVVLLGGDAGPYSMKDYVSVPAKRFTLGHNQRAIIPVTISIPPNVPAGGLYGSMLVSTISQEAKAGTADGTAPQSAIVSRIGSLFFITIPGDVERDGQLKEFGTVPPKTVFQSGPLNFGILFENSGSIHLAPYGELRIRNTFGEEVGYLELDPWFVFPQATRLREVSWNREFLFGRYTATVSINRSYDNIVDEMSYTLWVLPWKPLAGAFAVLFLVFFIIRFFFKNFEFKRKT